jgi:hypothetical protein
MKILTLLKSGPEFKPEHLYRLVDSILAHNPDAEIHCLTDCELDDPRVTPVRLDLWPKWWGKLQLFEYAINEPVLYFDIDTVCIGDVSSLVRTSRGFTMLPDVYKRGRVGSGVMSWYGDFSHIPAAFNAAPNASMVKYSSRSKWGDQAFIEDHLGFKPDLFGSELRSFKAHCKKGVPRETKVVYFHGQPRPWTIPKSALCLIP